MNSVIKIAIVLVIVLLCGTKVIGQEWEHSIAYSDNDTSCFNQYDAVELSNGHIAVGAALFCRVATRVDAAIASGGDVDRFRLAAARRHRGVVGRTERVLGGTLFAAGIMDRLFHSVSHLKLHLTTYVLYLIP